MAGNAASSVGGVLALDLDGVLFVSPEPAGVEGEYVDRRRVRVKVPRLRDVWGMRVSEPVWVSPSMIADVNAVIGLPGVRLVLVSSWGAAAVEAARQAGLMVPDGVVNVFEGRTVGAVNQDVKLAEALAYLRECAAAGERVVWVDDLHVPGFVEHDGIVTVGTNEDAGLTAPMVERVRSLLGGRERVRSRVFAVSMLSPAFS